MTRDEIRGLMGGYVTGSLSEADRKALFEAALDDQELFDELAREQALKELLDEPGVKERLMTALAPPQKRWWRTYLNKARVYAAAGAFATVVIAGIVLLEKPRQQEEKTREIARVTAPPTAPEPPVPPPAAPSNPAPAPIAAAPSPITATPAAPKATAPASLAEAAPAPAPLAAQTNAPASVGALSAVSAGAVGGVPAGGGGGGGRGGAGGAGNRAMLRAAAARFAFDYSVTPDRGLRVVPAARGFLTVAVNNATATTVLFSGRPVEAGSVTEIMLPSDVVSATVIFAASPQAASADVAATGGPVSGTMDPPSGTKFDANPSSNSRLTAVIQVSSMR